MAKRKKGYRRVYDEGTGKTKLGRRKEVDVYRPFTSVGKTLVKDITYKSEDSPRVKYTEREVTRRNKDGSVKSYKNIVRKNGKIVDEATTKKIKYDQGGFINVELSDEEVAKYKAEGYILEEMHEGGEPGHTHDGGSLSEVTVTGSRKDPPNKYYDKDGTLIEDIPSYGTIYTSDPNDPRIQEFKEKMRFYNLSKNHYLNMLIDEQKDWIEEHKKSIEFWKKEDPSQIKEVEDLIRDAKKNIANYSGKDYIKHYRYQGPKGGYKVGDDLFDDVLAGKYDKDKKYEGLESYNTLDDDNLRILKEGLKLGHKPLINNIGEGYVNVEYPYPSLTIKYADPEKYDWAKPVEEEPEIQIDRLPIIKPEPIKVEKVSIPEIIEEEDFNNDYKAKRVVDKETHYKVNKKGKIRRGPFGKKTTRRIRYELPEEEQFYPEEFAPMFEHGGPHDPPKVKQRKGVRENYDYKEWTPSGLQFPTSVSSHLMKAEYVGDIDKSTDKPVGWVGFPSLFQNSKPYANDQDNWVQTSEDNGWGAIYEEAKRRGEVYNFGKDKEAAIAFGEGSWKDQLPDEGIEVELTDEEVEEYRAGGYVLEELADGGEDDLITYKNNKKLIDGVVDWQSQSDVNISLDYNDQIKARLLTGNYGYNPKTGELVKLSKSQQTKVTDKYALDTKKTLKETAGMSSKEYEIFQDNEKEAAKQNAMSDYTANRKLVSIDKADEWNPSFTIQNESGQNINTQDYAGKQVYMTDAEEAAYKKTRINKNIPIAQQQMNTLFSIPASFTPAGLGIMGMHGAANLGLKSGPEFVENPSWGTAGSAGLDLLMSSPVVIPAGISTVKGVNNLRNVKLPYPKMDPNKLAATYRTELISNPPKPSLQIKSTMPGGPFEKQLSKTGEINVKNIQAHINKADVSKQDKFILQKTLDKNFAGQTKINYEDFKTVVSENLAPLKKTIVSDHASFGINRLNYKTSSSLPVGQQVEKSSLNETLKRIDNDIKNIDYELNNLQRQRENRNILERIDPIKRSDMQWEMKYLKGRKETLLKEKQSLIKNDRNKIVNLNETVLYGNADELGIGSDIHFNNNPETLGHSRVMVTGEEPEVMHFIETQSDWAQGGRKINVDRTKRIIEKRNKQVKTNKKYLKDIKDAYKKGEDFEGYPVYDYAVENAERNIANSQNELIQLQSELKNPDQKNFLLGSYKERLLQENMLHAAENGNTIVRYPISETAAKIQGYTPEVLEKQPSLQGIMNKYKNTPKMVKNILGVDVKTVTDVKGNTWYEWAIPEDFLQGTRPIRGLKKGGFIEAELSDEEVERYRAGGYTLEEMHEGGDIPLHNNPHDPPNYEDAVQAYKDSIAARAAYEDQYKLDLAQYEKDSVNLKKRNTSYNKKLDVYNKAQDKYARNQAYLKWLKAKYPAFPTYDEVYDASDPSKGIYYYEHMSDTGQNQKVEYAAGNLNVKNGDRELHLSPYYDEVIEIAPGNYNLDEIDRLGLDSDNIDEFTAKYLKGAVSDNVDINNELNSYNEFIDWGMGRSYANTDFPVITMLAPPNIKKPKSLEEQILKAVEYNPPKELERPSFSNYVDSMPVIKPELITNSNLEIIGDYNEPEELERPDYSNYEGLEQVKDRFRKGHYKDRQRVSAKIAQALTGYDAEKMDAEIEAADKEGRRINFEGIGLGAVSNKRFRKKYNKEYDKYEEALQEQEYLNSMPMFFKDGGSMELDLSPEEVTMYANGGYILEEIPQFAPGGVNDPGNPLSDWANQQASLWENLHEYDPKGRDLATSYFQNIGDDYNLSLINKGKMPAWSAATISNAVMANIGATDKQTAQILGFNPTASHSGYVRDAFKASKDPEYKYNRYVAEGVSDSDYGIGDILVKGRSGTKNWKYGDFQKANSSYKSHGDIIVDKGVDDKGEYVILAGGNLSDTYKNKKVYTNTLKDNYTVKLKDAKKGEQRYISSQKSDNLGEDVSINQKGSSPFANNFDWDIENDQAAEVFNKDPFPISSYDNSSKLVGSDNQALFGTETLGIGYVPYQYQFPDYLGRPEDEDAYAIDEDVSISNSINKNEVDKTDKTDKTDEIDEVDEVDEVDETKSIITPKQELTEDQILTNKAKALKEQGVLSKLSVSQLKDLLNPENIKDLTEESPIIKLELEALTKANKKYEKGLNEGKVWISYDNPNPQVVTKGWDKAQNKKNNINSGVNIYSTIGVFLDDEKRINEFGEWFGDGSKKYGEWVSQDDVDDAEYASNMSTVPNSGAAQEINILGDSPLDSPIIDAAFLRYNPLGYMAWEGAGQVVNRVIESEQGGPPLTGSIFADIKNRPEVYQEVQPSYKDKGFIESLPDIWDNITNWPIFKQEGGPISKVKDEGYVLDLDEEEAEQYVQKGYIVEEIK